MDWFFIVKKWFCLNENQVWVLFLTELVYNVLDGLYFALQVPDYLLKCLDVGMIVGHINCHMYMGHVAAVI